MSDSVSAALRALAARPGARSFVDETGAINVEICPDKSTPREPLIVQVPTLLQILHASMAEPIRATVVVWRCPFCKRSRTRKSATGGHIRHCFKNPDRVPRVGELSREHYDEPPPWWPGEGKIWDGERWRDVPGRTGRAWPVFRTLPLDKWPLSLRLDFLFGSLDCVHCGRALLVGEVADGDEVPCRACDGVNRVTADAESAPSFAACEVADCKACERGAE